MRLFIGIPLDDRLRAGLVGHYHRIAGLGDVKMVERENLHITLKFLGDTEPDKIDIIKNAIDLSVQGIESFFITSNMIASFGSEKFARVIWANVDKNGEKIIDIYDKLEEKLVAEGFKRDDKPFTAHITIARSKEGIDLRKPLRDLKFEYKSRVERVELYSSELTPAGARHTVLYEKKLDC
jgi:RNA 2',3'-cyclic 3'-phosphodiesterase